ncbi:hypothetical protein ZIOFF_063244 [Zingiber officinale]|uniref:Starch synthase catalytic domain-containing protein n=1 Tax=Zingiber officinale TaxID=94328 RepID=A0A8J5K9P5_ZINOF|nr:hypothetical protein ZIOFF_063244 [Zingiber officinale]
MSEVIWYYTDPSGTFWQCNAKAIGSGSEGADSSLQEQYNKDLSLLEAETIALSILKQVMEEKVTPNNVDIAKVAPTYHLYTPAEETWRRNTTSVQVNVTFKCGIVGYCWRIASPVYAENIVNEEVDCLTSPFWFSYLKEVEGFVPNIYGMANGLLAFQLLGSYRKPLNPRSGKLLFLCADDKLKKMTLRVIAESLSEEEIAGLKEAIPCDGHQQQRLVNDECGSRVLLTAERSPPARYSFFIPTSADIFLWMAFRKQRIPAEESDCALFSSELLLNFITDVVGSSGDSVPQTEGSISVHTPIPAEVLQFQHKHSNSGRSVKQAGRDQGQSLCAVHQSICTNIKQSTRSSAKTRNRRLSGPDAMNVIVVAAECAPWSKTGMACEVGDVARTLPKALAKRGHRVMFKSLMDKSDSQGILAYGRQLCVEEVIHLSRLVKMVKLIHSTVFPSHSRHANAQHRAETKNPRLHQILRGNEAEGMKLLKMFVVE